MREHINIIVYCHHSLLWVGSRNISTPHPMLPTAFFDRSIQWLVCFLFDIETFVSQAHLVCLIQLFTFSIFFSTEHHTFVSRFFGVGAATANGLSRFDTQLLLWLLYYLLSDRNYIVIVVNSSGIFWCSKQVFQQNKELRERSRKEEKVSDQLDATFWYNERWNHIHIDESNLLGSNQIHWKMAYC